MTGRSSLSAGLAQEAPVAAPRVEEAARGNAWHPYIHRIHDYWCSIHPQRGLPGRRHLEPMQIPELLPSLWLLDVQQEPFALRYRLVGTLIVNLLGREVTGLSFPEAHPGISLDSAYLERYRLAASKGVPSWRRGTPNFFSRPGIVSVESLIMPLAADGEQVDMLMILSVPHGDEGIAGDDLRRFVSYAGR